MRKTISVKSAKENNLKNVSVEIPRDALTVITGVSGSGKSTLAFDVIYGEGQRRFLESLSPFVKRFIPQLKKPDVEFVYGLSPVVSIEQKTGMPNPRSTVGTMSEISDYMRLVFSRIGVAHCPHCGVEIPMKSAGQIAERILSLPPGVMVELYAPVKKIFGEDYPFLFDEIRSKGYRRFKIDGELIDTSDQIELDEHKQYDMEVFIDKYSVKREIYKQLKLSIESGLKIGEGYLHIVITDADVQRDMVSRFYDGFACAEHHLVVGELEPYYFSFNEPDSECRTCLGIGTYKHAKPELMIANREKSLRKGALDERIYKLSNPKSWRNMMIYSLSQHYHFSLDTPFKDFPEEIIDILFYGTKGERFPFLGAEDGTNPTTDPWIHSNVGKLFTFEGIVNEIDRWYRKSRRKQELAASEESMFKKVMVEYTCPECNGTRLKLQRMLVRLGDKNIYELGVMPLDELKPFLQSLVVPEHKREIGEPILHEIVARLDLLLDIGLDYLSLGRRSDSISGGESQRIRLSTQIGSGLMGMLYVLDEPSIGLHPRDGSKVIDTLKRLRDIGNTVIVVEHDVDTINEADHVIEIGPGAGIHGGTVVFQGTMDELKADSSSLTGQYMSGKKSVEAPATRKAPGNQWLKVINARENTLKNINVDIPLGVFTCVTGVSGSGKSSLINEVLFKQLSRTFHDPRIIPGVHDAIEGSDQLNNVINIDQSPIGRMPTSNPATYVGFFDQIRKLFASLPESVERGYTASDFSFNVKGGRCEECRGYGIVTTQLQFMPEVQSLCPSCKGARYSSEVLEVQYNGKSISDVLELPIEEAELFFRDERTIAHKLGILNELGLGYLKLGQSSSILSGGEAQRIKLATELGKMKRGAHNLYILDEPTTGLHLADIQKLLYCLNRLIDAGHTVLVIEHHLDVIKTADYVIDLGPEAGKRGGFVVATGTPEQIMAVPESHTGQCLKQLLEKRANM